MVVSTLALGVRLLEDTDTVIPIAIPPSGTPIVADTFTALTHRWVNTAKVLQPIEVDEM